MKHLRTMYLVSPDMGTSPDGSPVSSRKLTVHSSHDSAVIECERVLGLSTCSYSGMIIYRAVSLVARTAPPIEVLDIGKDGEVE